MEHSNKPMARDVAADAAGEEWANQAKPLRECGEIAATRLAAVFSNALKRAADQLFEKATQGAASHEQRLWLDAADFGRSRRQDMVDAFRKHFQHRYGLACRQKSATSATPILSFQNSHLEIIDHEVLDCAMDPAELIEAIRNGSWSALRELTKWFRDAQGKPDLIPDEMPLGPKLIGGAVIDAINDQFWGHDARRRLTSALCRTLPEPINRVYLDLTAHLARSGDTVQSLEELEARFTAAPPTPSFSREIENMGAGSAQADIPVPASDLANAAEIDPAALAMADQAISKWRTDPRLPEFVQTFLTGPWHDLLIHIHGEHGASGPDWDTALATLDDLARSLFPPANAGERARLMRELPVLVRRLKRGLETLDASASAFEPFLDRLADHHVKLLGSSRTTPDMPPVYTRVGIPLETLEVGVWLEIVEADGPPRALKLAWISPRRKLFILTDQQGQRALSLNAKDLATRLRDGKARLLPAPDSAQEAAPGDKGIAQSSDNKKTA